MKPSSPEMPIGCIATLNALGQADRVIVSMCRPAVAGCGHRRLTSSLNLGYKGLRTTSIVFGDCRQTYTASARKVCRRTSAALSTICSRSRPTHPAGVVAKATRSRSRRRSSRISFSPFSISFMLPSGANRRLHVPVVPPETLPGARRTGSSGVRLQGSPSGVSAEYPLQCRRQTWRSHTFI